MAFFANLLGGLFKKEELEESRELNFLSAVEAHMRWRRRLEAYIRGVSSEHLDPEVICRDDACVLGQWIHGLGGEHYGRYPLFRELRQTHAQFHTCAGEIVRVADAGQTDEAMELLEKGDYSKTSHTVRSQLARLSREIG